MPVRYGLIPLKSHNKTTAMIPKITSEEPEDCLVMGVSIIDNYQLPPSPPPSSQLPLSPPPLSQLPLSLLPLSQLLPLLSLLLLPLLSQLLLPPLPKKNHPEPVLLFEVTLPDVLELLEKKLCNARKPARMAMINLMNARPTMLTIS
jgi:hypothetical protein